MDTILTSIESDKSSPKYRGCKMDTILTSIESDKSSPKYRGYKMDTILMSKEYLKNLGYQAEAFKRY